MPLLKQFRQIGNCRAKNVFENMDAYSFCQDQNNRAAIRQELRKKVVYISCPIGQMMKYLSASLFALFLFFPGGGELLKTVRATVTVPKFAASPVIDGKPDEEMWETGGCIAGPDPNFSGGQCSGVKTYGSLSRLRREKSLRRL